jgi:hypothetical protein
VPITVGSKRCQHCQVSVAHGHERWAYGVVREYTTTESGRHATLADLQCA